MKKFISSLLVCCMLATTAFAAPLISPPPVTPAATAPSEWAVDSVSLAKTFEILPTELDSNYQAPITRVEFCTLIANLLVERTSADMNKILTAYGKEITAFADTTDANMLACAALGIISGTGDNKLNPTGNLTREEAAKILHNLALFLKITLPKPTTPTDGTAPVLPIVFTDMNKVSSWAKDSVTFVSHLTNYSNVAVMGGKGNSMFVPKDTFSREESIVTTMRMRTHIGTLRLPAVTFPEKILETIEKECEGEMVPNILFYDDTLTANYNISLDDLVAYSGSTAMMITSSQEFFIAEVKAGKMDVVKAACEKRQQDVEKASGWYVDGETIRGYKIVTKGNYIMFAMTRQMDKAIEVFNRMAK